MGGGDALAGVKQDIDSLGFNEEAESPFRQHSPIGGIFTQGGNPKPHFSLIIVYWLAGDNCLMMLVVNLSLPLAGQQQRKDDVTGAAWNPDGKE